MHSLMKRKKLMAKQQFSPAVPFKSRSTRHWRKPNLVLLIGYSVRADSKWIKHEIDTADSLLLPILPICFRDKGDRKRDRGSHRFVHCSVGFTFQTPNTTANCRSTVVSSNKIVTDAEQYLCEIFQEKM